MSPLEQMNSLHASHVKPVFDKWVSAIMEAREVGEAHADKEAIEGIVALENIEKAAKEGQRILRDAMAEYMSENGLLGFNSTHYSAGLSAAPQTVTVTDENAVRAARPDLFEPQPDKLNRTELTKKLKHGDAVPGATLSNGGAPRLVIRARKDLAK